jgi:hypothetical protein
MLDETWPCESREKELRGSGDLQGACGYRCPRHLEQHGALGQIDMDISSLRGRGLAVGDPGWIDFLTLASQRQSQRRF